MQIELHLYDSGFDVKYQPRHKGMADDLLDLIKVFSPQYLAKRKVCNMKGWDIPRRLIVQYWCCNKQETQANGDLHIDAVPYGLLSIVKRWISNSKIPAKMVNCLDKNKGLLKAINTKLKNKYDLRGYQIGAAEGLMEKPFGLCKAITGSGKTRIMRAVVTNINQPTVILMYSKSLVNQWYASFADIGIKPMRVYEGKVKAGDNNNIIIATFQSMCKPKMLKKSIYWVGYGDEDKSPFQALHPRLDPGLHEERSAKIAKLLPGFPECIKMIVVDEAHTAPSITYYSTLLCFNPIWCYGCTATPYRESGDTLMMYAMFSDRIVEVEFEDVEEFLTVPSLIQIEVTSYLGQQDIEEQQEFLMGSEFVHLLCSDIFRLRIIARVAEVAHREGKQFLIVCGYVWLVEAVDKLLRLRCIFSALVAGTYNSKEKDRERIKAGLADRSLPGVIATTTFDVGIDVPTLEVIIFAYPFGSKTRVIQRTGRVARSSADKPTSTVVDIVDTLFGRTKTLADKRAKILKEEFHMDVTGVIPQHQIEQLLPNML